MVKKKSYEKPSLISLDNSKWGVGNCDTGSGDAYHCNQYGISANMYCSSEGSSAGTQCQTGDSANADCQIGNSASTCAVVGSSPG